MNIENELLKEGLIEFLRMILMAHSISIKILVRFS